MIPSFIKNAILTIRQQTVPLDSNGLIPQKFNQIKVESSTISVAEMFHLVLKISCGDGNALQMSLLVRLVVTNAIIEHRQPNVLVQCYKPMPSHTTVAGQ